MISIAILCGGRSKRFKSNKVAYPVDGKPMVRHVFDRLKGLSDDIFLQTSDINFDLVRDNLPGSSSIYCDIGESKGALVGIHSALKHAKNERVFIVGCDMPFIDPNLLEILLVPKKKIVVPRWKDGTLEPMGTIYTRDILFLVEELLKRGEFRISDLLRAVPDDEIEWIDIDPLIEDQRLDKKCFMNINSQSDLENLSAGDEADQRWS